MSTTYAFVALPVLYGLVYLFGAIRIYRHEPLLGVLSFVFLPAGAYAAVRYWNAKEDNPRVPVLVAIGLLAIWLGMIYYGEDRALPDENLDDPSGFVRVEDVDPAAARLRLALAVANLPYRLGIIDLPEAKAQIDMPVHFRFVSAASLRAAGLDTVNVPHAESIGWMVHESVNLATDDAWAIEVDWFGEGYVSSERLTAFGNVALLAEARATAERLAELDASEEVELVRFAETPVFDVSEARLTWIEEVAYAGERSLDCHAVKLGRGGALMFTVASMEPQRHELCLLAVRLAAGSSRFEHNHASADYSRLFDSKSPIDLVDIVTGRNWLPES